MDNFSFPNGTHIVTQSLPDYFHCLSLFQLQEMEQLDFTRMGLLPSTTHLALSKFITMVSGATFAVTIALDSVRLMWCVVNLDTQEHLVTHLLR